MTQVVPASHLPDDLEFSITVVSVVATSTSLVLLV